MSDVRDNCDADPLARPAAAAGFRRPLPSPLRDATRLLQAHRGRDWVVAERKSSCESFSTVEALCINLAPWVSETAMILPDPPQVEPSTLELACTEGEEEIRRYGGRSVYGTQMREQLLWLRDGGPENG